MFCHCSFQLLPARPDTVKAWKMIFPMRILIDSYNPKRGKIQIVSALQKAHAPEPRNGHRPHQWEKRQSKEIPKRAQQSETRGSARGASATTPNRWSSSKFNRISWDIQWMSIGPWMSIFRRRSMQNPSMGPTKPNISIKLWILKKMMRLFWGGWGSF